MSLGPGIHRRNFVRNGHAKCHECGQQVPFLTSRGIFAEHTGTKGNRPCRPSYEGVAFVLPDGTELRNPSRSRRRPAQRRLSRAEEAHQHAPHQYTPREKASTPKRSEAKANRKTGRSRRARWEDRSRQRRMERYAMADPFEPARLQDFDVPDNSNSVRATPGGIPSSNRRRH